MEAQIILRREIEPGGWTVLCFEGNSYVLLAEDAEELQALLFSWYEAVEKWRDSSQAEQVIADPADVPWTAGVKNGHRKG